MREKAEKYMLSIKITNEPFYGTTVKFFNIINRNGLGDIVYKAFSVESLSPFLEGYIVEVKSTNDINQKS